MPLNILIRLTRDPYGTNVKYIAFCRITLADNADLVMRNIHLGNKEPLWVINAGKWHTPTTHSYLFSAQCLPCLICDDPEFGPTITVVERTYAIAAYERELEEDRIRRRKEKIAYVKGLFTRGWSYITLAPSTSTSRPKHASSHTDEDVVPVLSNASGIANHTSVLIHRGRMHKKGYLAICTGEDDLTT